MMLKLVLVTALLVMGAEAHCHPYSCDKANPRLQLCLNHGYKPEKLEGCKVGKGDWDMSDIQKNICKKLEEKVLELEEKCDFKCEKQPEWTLITPQIKVGDADPIKAGTPTPILEIGNLHLKFTELKKQEDAMAIFIVVALFGDDGGKQVELGRSNYPMNMNKQADGRRKISGQNRFYVTHESVENGQCNNNRDDFPMLNTYDMELEWDMGSDEIVKFTSPSIPGDTYSEDMTKECDDYDKWAAMVKRATHMQMKLSSWYAKWDEYITMEYKVVN